MKKIFKVLILITFLFINNLTCSASTKTYNREETENYGVNKNWKITSENKNNILNTPLVNAEEKIYDYADILEEHEEVKLKEKIDEFINETKMDMVIVIPSFKYYSDNENETYAADFYDYNDFGLKYPNNSGILLLRNNYEEDPYYNIYTFGNAQLVFDYDRLENILDNIYNDISGKNYLVAFTEYIDELLVYYKQGIPNSMKNYKVNENGYLYKPYSIPWPIVLLISSLTTGIIMTILIKKNKMVKKANEASVYLDTDSVNITEKQDTFITAHTSSYTISSSSGGGSGGGFSSSGSSGGGHSSGGGRHG